MPHIAQKWCSMNSLLLNILGELIYALQILWPLQAPLNQVQFGWRYKCIRHKKIIGIYTNMLHVDDIPTSSTYKEHMDILWADSSFCFIQSSPLCILSLKTQITVWPPAARFTLPKTFGSCDSSQAEAGSPRGKERREKEELSHSSTVATALFTPPHL